MKNSYYYCKNPKCKRPSGVCGYLYPSKEHGVVCPDCWEPEVIKTNPKRGKPKNPLPQWKVEKRRAARATKAKRGMA